MGSFLTPFITSSGKKQRQWQHLIIIPLSQTRPVQWSGTLLHSEGKNKTVSSSNSWTKKFLTEFFEQYLSQLLKQVCFIFLGKVFIDLVWLNLNTCVCCQNLLIPLVSHKKGGNHYTALGDFGSIKRKFHQGGSTIFRTNCVGKDLFPHHLSWTNASTINNNNNINNYYSYNNYNKLLKKYRVKKKHTIYVPNFLT